MTDATHTAGWTVPKAGLIGFAASVCVALVALLLTDGKDAAGGAAGAVAGAIGGLVGLTLVGRVKGTSPQPVMAALVVAFLLRIVLVAIGIVLTLKLGSDPMAFVLAFFPLFMVFVVLEGLVAGTQLKAARANSTGGA